MKTIAQSLTVSVAIYTVLFLLIASVAFGSELNLNNNSKVVPPEIVFEDEAYIDDIPFDTQAIAEAYLLNETMSVEFDFEEEAYVDDIPFNTNEVVKNYKTEEYLKNIFEGKARYQANPNCITGSSLGSNRSAMSSG